MNVRIMRGDSFHENGRLPVSMDARYASSSAYFTSAGWRRTTSFSFLAGAGEVGAAATAGALPSGLAGVVGNSAAAAPASAGAAAPSPPAAAVSSALVFLLRVPSVLAILLSSRWESGSES